MNPRIKRFTEINELFETTGFEKRTDISDFFIFKFEELSKGNILRMPPYQKYFYQIPLIINSDSAEIEINEQENKSLENTLYFLSPEHVFSWQRNFKTTGYIVYFKNDFLNFFTKNFKEEFAFFDIFQTNFIKIENIEELSNDFEKLYKEYYTLHSYRIQIIQSSLLSLLFKCKSLKELLNPFKQNFTKKQSLVFKFQNLVSNCYISQKKVDDYAKQLYISANTLTQYVKEVTGKSAKEIIAEKIIQEAKKLLQYSSDDISQIAYNIGFDEPTHFIRFFKNQTATTPKEYRKSKM